MGRKNKQAIPFKLVLTNLDMILIGLTGGIGSGKTTVSNAFAKLGAPIVDTDIIARDVLKSQPKLLKQLSTTFGDTVINSDGSLNRGNLRKIAFANTNNKTKLDNIMHPAIRKQTLFEISQHNKAAYCIVAVPLLIETDFKTLVDRVLVVTAPHQLRLKWLKQRSGLEPIEAEAIIKSQTSDEERLSYAQDHIVNDKDIDNINKQVQELHIKYLAIAEN